MSNGYLKLTAQMLTRRIPVRYAARQAWWGPTCGCTYNPYPDHQLLSGPQQYRSGKFGDSNGPGGGRDLNSSICACLATVQAADSQPLKSASQFQGMLYVFYVRLALSKSVSAQVHETAFVQICYCTLITLPEALIKKTNMLHAASLVRWGAGQCGCCLPPDNTIQIKHHQLMGTISV